MRRLHSIDHEMIGKLFAQTSLRPCFDQVYSESFLFELIAGEKSKIEKEENKMRKDQSSILLNWSKWFEGIPVWDCLLQQPLNVSFFTKLAQTYNIRTLHCEMDAKKSRKNVAKRKIENRWRNNLHGLLFLWQFLSAPSLSTSRLHWIGCVVCWKCQVRIYKNK